MTEFHRPGPNDPSDEGYVYHATNVDGVYGIADAGHLHVHRPWHGTDQGEWPDQSTEKRAYFSGAARHVWPFVPENGPGVVLRVKKAEHPFKREPTGDIYTTKKIPNAKIEVRRADGSWHPISTLTTKREESMNRQPLLIEMDAELRAAERRSQEDPGDTVAAGAYAHALRRAGRHREARGIEMAPYIARFQAALDAPIEALKKVPGAIIHGKYDVSLSRAYPREGREQREKEGSARYREIVASHEAAHQALAAAQERDGVTPDRDEIVHHFQGPPHSDDREEHERFVAHLHRAVSVDPHRGSPLHEPGSAKAVAERIRGHYPRAAIRVTVGPGHDEAHLRGMGRRPRSRHVHVDDFGLTGKTKPQKAVQRVGRVWRGGQWHDRESTPLKAVDDGLRREESTLSRLPLLIETDAELRAAERRAAMTGAPSDIAAVHARRLHSNAREHPLTRAARGALRAIERSDDAGWNTPAAIRDRARAQRAVGRFDRLANEFYPIGSGSASITAHTERLPHLLKHIQPRVNGDPLMHIARLARISFPSSIPSMELRTEPDNAGSAEIRIPHATSPRWATTIVPRLRALKAAIEQHHPAASVNLAITPHPWRPGDNHYSLTVDGLSEST